MFINQSIILTIIQDNAIQARAMAAVEIPFLPFCAFLSSDHDENTRNQQYSIYTRATKDNIQSIQLIVIWIKLSAYHRLVAYSDFCLYLKCSIQCNLSAWLVFHSMISPLMFQLFIAGSLTSGVGRVTHAFCKDRDLALLKLGRKTNNQINKYTHIL